jgi:hypothetical protein
MPTGTPARTAPLPADTSPIKFRRFIKIVALQCDPGKNRKIETPNDRIVEKRRDDPLFRRP